MLVLTRNRIRRSNFLQRVVAALRGFDRNSDYLGNPTICAGILPSVPRYFFDTANGERFRDSEGLDLGGPNEARSYAVRFAGECLAHGPDALDDRDFRVVVRNADDLVLFTVTTFVTESPAMAGTPSGKSGR